MIHEILRLLAAIILVKFYEPTGLQIELGGWGLLLPAFAYLVGYGLGRLGTRRVLLIPGQTVQRFERRLERFEE